MVCNPQKMPVGYSYCRHKGEVWGLGMVGLGVSIYAYARGSNKGVKIVMPQKHFGKTEIIPVEKTRTKCSCGNNAVIMIKNDEINHYCRNCAKDYWLEIADKYE